MIWLVSSMSFLTFSLRMAVLFRDSFREVMFFYNSFTCSSEHLKMISSLQWP